MLRLPFQARTVLRSSAPLPRRALSTSLPRRSSSSDESDLTHPALLKDPPASNPSAETDPWSLTPPPMPTPPPLDPSIHTMDDLIRSPHPEGRDHEETETLRKRLVYESRKRGILEMDLILSTFAKERLPEMGDRELREYDRFLTLPDWTIFYYVTGKAEAPEPWKSSKVLRELLDHSANRGKTVRRMPDLETKQ
ncbi:SPOSA6832_01858 [Sporobolomyces salmonicolor]|uniref:Succinate dehydrogenase assembly factor 2, mitochondrial n=1 Tax=Sporidiobolus salmonicolor TaxID=5005 RepID=A0A0D6EKX3_SPOSA|nr:SPOSA6832_01858 [Sporobolomyces salmonicolor]